MDFTSRRWCHRESLTWCGHAEPSIKGTKRGVPQPWQCSYRKMDVDKHQGSHNLDARLLIRNVALGTMLHHVALSRYQESQIGKETSEGKPSSWTPPSPSAVPSEVSPQAPLREKQIGQSSPWRWPPRRSQTCHKEACAMKKCANLYVYIIYNIYIYIYICVCACVVIKYRF